MDAPGGGGPVGRAVFLLPRGEKQKRPHRVTGTSKSGQLLHLQHGSKVQLSDVGKTWEWAPERRAGGISLRTLPHSRSEAVSSGMLKHILAKLRPALPRGVLAQLRLAVLQEALVIGVGNRFAILDPHCISDVLVELSVSDPLADGVLLHSPCCVRDGHLYILAEEPWATGPSDGRPVTRIQRLPLPLRAHTLPDVVAELPIGAYSKGFRDRSRTIESVVASQAGVCVAVESRALVYNFDAASVFEVTRNSLPEGSFIESAAGGGDGSVVMACTIADDSTYNAHDRYPIAFFRACDGVADTLTVMEWEYSNSLIEMLLLCCSRGDLYFNHKVVAWPHRSELFVAAHSEVPSEGIPSPSERFTCHILRVRLNQLGPQVQKEAEAHIPNTEACSIVVGSEIVCIHAKTADGRAQKVHMLDRRTLALRQCIPLPLEDLFQEGPWLNGASVASSWVTY